MKAFLIDPEVRTIKETDFDGDVGSIPHLLGCKDIRFEQWPIGGSHTIGTTRATRVYSDAKAVGNSAMHGFQVPNTCGIISHGRCLQVTYNTWANAFVDCDENTETLKRKYRIYEPEKGIDGKQQWK
jgi:hypothetical protein